MTDNKKRPCHKTNDAASNSDKCVVSPKGLCALTKEHNSSPHIASLPPAVVLQPCKIMTVDKCPKETCVQYNGEIRQGCREKPSPEKPQSPVHQHKTHATTYGYIGLITHGGGIVPFFKSIGHIHNIIYDIETI